MTQDQNRADNALAREKQRKARNKAQAKEETKIHKEITRQAVISVEGYKKRKHPKAMTAEQKEELLDLMCNGMSLSAICRLHHMPSPSTVYEELRMDPLFSENYSRARESLAHTLFFSALDIADNVEGDVRRDTLRVETRFRVAGKLHAPVYGDRPTVTHSGPVTVNAVTVSGRDLDPDTREKLRALLTQARAEQAKLIEG